MSRLSRTWPLAAALASVAALAVAHGLERFGHLAPCELCLKEREAYWAALAVGIAGVAAGRLRPRWGTLACAALALVFLAGAGLSAYHAGVEWKLWPGPAACTGVGRVGAADIRRFLAGGATAMPRCDRPALVVLGLSLAGWNVLLSLGLAAASLTAALRDKAGRASS